MIFFHTLSFFFFKQKTAYEMRISDWSSDVCSSDLRDPRIGDLVRHLNRHVAAFAKDCAFDLGGKRLKLDSLWINVLEPGGTPSWHIHPHSVVSGTIYVAMPPGSGALKLEDPRLPMLMAPPGRHDYAPHVLQPFPYSHPAPPTPLL